MITRIITGIVLALVAGTLLLLNPTTRFVLIGLTVIGLAIEINQIRKPSIVSKSILLTLVGFICFAAWTNHLESIWLTPCVSIASVFVMVIMLIEIFREKIWGQSSSLVFTLRTGLFYLATLPYIFIGLEDQLFGVLIIIALAATDTCAYFIGKSWGRNQLTKLSPKKTIEGAIAGLITTPTCIIVINHFFKIIHLPLSQTILLGIGISILAQIGDIHESLLKRLFNIKDSSNILPGHGGVYDRIDSYIFSIPITVMVLYFWSIP